MGRATGRVATTGETWFPVTLIGKKVVATEALLDTGFDDFLSMPRDLADDLGLPVVGLEDYVLADGSTITSEMVAVRVLFAGRSRRIVGMVSESNEILMGVQLLRGHCLTIRYRRRTARLALDR